jgi:hypothetical protein
MHQYWFTGYPVSEVVKCFLVSCCPYPFCVFSCEFIEWSCDVGESSNEWLIKIAKTQKRSDVLNFGGRRPIFNACNFDGVHVRYPLFKDYPQVIHTRGMECTLLRFEI